MWRRGAFDTSLETDFVTLLRLQLDNESYDPYGDGDQSPLRGREAQELRSVWAKGADYNPITNKDLSKWLRDCYNGHLPAVRQHLDLDPKVLEKRESMLRVCGLFHLVSGARTVNSEAYPPQVRARVGPDTDYIGCARLMIERGARLDAKDCAGHTPLHHATGAYSNKLSLQIARLLLENGADPNAVNRFGCTPLFEAAQNNKVSSVELLFEFGARGDVVDNDGVLLRTISNFFPNIAKATAEAEHRRLFKEKLDGKRQQVSCAVCKGTSDLKRCTGCFKEFYCNMECQKKGWPVHKSACKVEKQRYKPVNLLRQGTECVANFRNNNIDVYDSKHKMAPQNFPKSVFIVKVQIALVELTDYKRWLQSKKGPVPQRKTGLLVYNKDRSVFGHIPPTEEVYGEIFNLIANEGISLGVKGFLRARYDSQKGLMINTKSLCDPEPW